MTGLEVDLRLEGPLGFLSLRGEARQEVIHHLDEQARRALERGARSLILDCARLAFMDSASTGVLLRIQKDLEVRGGKLVLCSVPRVIRRMFDASGLRGRFAEAPDEQQARGVEAGGAPPPEPR